MNCATRGNPHDHRLFHLYTSPSTAATHKARMPIRPVNGATLAETYNGRGALFAMFDVGPHIAATP